MKNFLTSYLPFLLVVAACIGVGFHLVSVWNECREFGHSFGYCMRMISN